MSGVDETCVVRLQRECEMTQSVCHQALRHESCRNIQGHLSRDFHEPARWDHGLFRVATEDAEPSHCITNGEIGYAHSKSFHNARSLQPWNEWQRRLILSFAIVNIDEINAGEAHFN